jgi:hypothetical protein
MTVSGIIVGSPPYLFAICAAGCFGLEKAIPIKMLDEAEVVRASDFAKAISALYDGCQKKGGYTTEAALFVDTYGPPRGDQEGIDRKVEEVFGVKTGK